MQFHASACSSRRVGGRRSVDAVVFVNRIDVKLHVNDGNLSMLGQFASYIGVAVLNKRRPLSPRPVARRSTNSKRSPLSAGSLGLRCLRSLSLTNLISLATVEMNSIKQTAALSSPTASTFVSRCPILLIFDSITEANGGGRGQEKRRRSWRTCSNRSGTLAD